MPRRAIGFFDSGEGGLTVARAVARLLPGEAILYACDTARFPYGPRPMAEVRHLCLRFLEFFAAQGCKLVVIACNTATAAVLDLLDLDEGLPLPVIGVVPPGARAAALASHSGRIGVAATEGTCNAGIYPRLIAQQRSGAQVFQEPCPILVIRAEEGIIAGPEVRTEVERCLAPLLHAGVDTLVLGCTHFPHMQAVIAEVVGEGITLVDPGVAAAIEVAERLQAIGFVNPDTAGERRFVTTGDPGRFLQIASRLWPGAVQNCERIELAMEQE